MIKQQGFFIAGTDTGVGKTMVTTCILHALLQHNYRAIGIKPLATGGYEDGHSIQQALGHKLPDIALTTISPITFEPPIAPHLAALEANTELSVAKLITACKPGFSYPADYIIVEGVGGWQVPINDTETMADFAVAIGWPVILVVGIRLGCINHTLLTYNSIKAAGAELFGWVANIIDPEMLSINENIASLEQRLAAPRLATIAYLATVGDSANDFAVSLGL